MRSLKAEPDAATPFETRIETVSDAQVLVQARGELDLATAPSFSRAVISAIGLGRPENVVDMSGVTFCDSQGLTALLATTIHAEAEGAELAFVHLHPRVSRVVRLVGLDRRLNLPGLPAGGGERART
ncbi:STAS domain-containing protein [Actinomadura barringtoniae]|uniref:Anti-sigma factor antagonist n=1 Tax=Actinomadura barringtoniae TaxID=1427535 RepID=A0A939PNB0_9ACTN|nr:STAS domain-containing protein [Actinomadura barringtoniae]MBO2455188.1 STAS domain-containing protein [Actinomadura barringtoniae]